MLAEVHFVSGDELRTNLPNENTICSLDLRVYGVSLRTKINIKKRSDLLGEINSDIKIMCSNKQNVTLKQKIMVQDNKKMWF